MTDRMPDEQIAELAETPDYWLDFRTAQIRSALRQTRADLAQANATIAERDAEIARLREALQQIAYDAGTPQQNYDRNGPSWISPTGSEYEDTCHFLAKCNELFQTATAGLKETEHD